MPLYVLFRAYEAPLGHPYKKLNIPKSIFIRKGVDGDRWGSYGVKRNVWAITWGHGVDLMSLLMLLMAYMPE